MATLSNSYSHSASRSESAGVSRYERFIENLKFSHFALISMAILIGSCLGGITAMYVFMSGAPIWMFVIGLAVSLSNLVACIAQAPTKWVFNLFILSLIVNTALIISTI